MLDASSPQAPLSRRRFLGTAALGTLALGLSACGNRHDVVRFYQSKPEAVPYFRDLLTRLNDRHNAPYRIVHDTIAANLSSSFARATPPDLGCLNYNYEMARFQERGELSDVGDIVREANIDPSIQNLVDQYPTYPGRTCAIPYSMMAAATFYHKDVFDQHGLAVPTTYAEFIEVCEKLQAAGITPMYITAADSWTVAQGIADYSVGGAVDVEEFFRELQALGKNAGPGQDVSFSSVLRDPLRKARDLTRKYANPDSASRKYGDGNVAFANKKAAMYLQGPWALGDILTINPKADIGVFPLPMTDKPEDRKVRVNLDLALWVPEKATNPDGARDLARYLITPEVADAYNQKNLGFGVRKDAPDATDPRLQDMQKYVDRAAYYQGLSTAIPRTIPFKDYMQGIFLGQDLDEALNRLDGDWHRLAVRQPEKD